MIVFRTEKKWKDIYISSSIILSKDGEVFKTKKNEKIDIYIHISCTIISSKMKFLNRKKKIMYVLWHIQEWQAFETERRRKGSMESLQKKWKAFNPEK